VRLAVALASGLALAAATARAQTPGPPAAEYGRAAKLEVQTFEGPSGRIRFEFPKKDWQVVPGGSAAIVSLLQRKGEAAVVVERTRLNQPLAPDDITDLFGQLEGETVRDQQPAAADIRSSVYETGGRRFVIVTYGRGGVLGPERVRQYSFPVGGDLYRLTCSAPAAQFARYEPVFAHVAATFTVAAAARPGE